MESQEEKEERREEKKKFEQNFILHLKGNFYEISSLRKVDKGLLKHELIPGLSSKEKKELLKELNAEEEQVFHWEPPEYTGFTIAEKYYKVMVVRENGPEFYRVTKDDRVIVERISEEQFPSKITVKRSVEKKDLGLGIGGETKETSKQLPKPEELFFIPENMERAINNFISKYNFSIYLSINMLEKLVKQDGMLKLKAKEGLEPATPYEFYIRREGDCLDFAILTYVIGKKLNLPITIISSGLVEIKENGRFDFSAHAFCMVKTELGYRVIDPATGNFLSYNGGEYVENPGKVAREYIEKAFPSRGIMDIFIIHPSGEKTDDLVRGAYMYDYGATYKNGDWLKKASEYGYNTEHLYFALAFHVYLSGGDPEEGLRYLENIHEENITTLWLKGALYLMKGDYVAAEQCASNIIKNYENCYDGYALHGEVLRKQGRHEECYDVWVNIWNRWPSTDTARRLIFAVARIVDFYKKHGAMDKSKEWTEIGVEWLKIFKEKFPDAGFGSEEYEQIIR